jgi:hypothetical protein
MKKRLFSNEVMDEWFRPLHARPESRQDLRKYATSILSKEVLLE